MSAKPKLRVRQSITQLQDQYTAGNKTPLENLWRAWIEIKKLTPEDPRSFFALGGFHGEPFRGPGKTDSQYWGGYCHHGNVLFPTWHRMYIFKLEEALRSVRGCQDVTLPYWDETSTDSQVNGIPWALTRPTVKLDGKTIPNPLCSFKLTPRSSIESQMTSPSTASRRATRLSATHSPGLVGTADAKRQSGEHNADFTDYTRDVRLLNQNIINWLGDTMTVAGKQLREAKSPRCIVGAWRQRAYTLFSNKTSEGNWNDDVTQQGRGSMMAALETAARYHSRRRRQLRRPGRRWGRGRQWRHGRT